MVPELLDDDDDNNNNNNNNVACRGVTYKTGFGLDDWIYCTLHFHTLRDYRKLQLYRYSTHITVHHYTRTRILSLH
jgi:hypothetical protein